MLKKAIAPTGIKLVRSRYYESAIYLSESARDFYAFSRILLQNFTRRCVKISRNRVSVLDISVFFLNRRGRRGHRGRVKVGCVAIENSGYLQRFGSDAPYRIIKGVRH
ncbi:hypothetical protein [Microcoleus sp. herbarium8]|uniref:hypothetical protein n=1 Tax=Microcoleus sp. herbarium8 TaxID=3055436 RepID=UPI002FD6D4CF